MVYAPAGRNVAAKAPESSDVSVRVEEESVFLMVTVAPGMAAPLASTTIPEMVPVAAADCNDSSGTTVCAQGDIRGTHAPPPSRPDYGFGFGYGCGYICYGSFGSSVPVGP